MVEYERTDCIELLKEKHSELLQNSENRFPKKDDFTVEQVVAIKSQLGPWPRALEKAGIKEVNLQLEQKKLDKRIERKRKATAAKITGRKQDKTE